MYNLAEVTSIIPRSKVGSFHHARKTGKSFRDLEFIDDAAQRVLLDVVKGDAQAHISTSVGKASFLRSRMSARPEVQGKMHVASFLQDGILNTSRSPDPKYLPGYMGGTNVTGLFGEPMNIWLYVQSYKGGTYQRVYGSATQEAIDTLEAMDVNNIPQSLVLCSALRLKQEYLHGTYGANVAVPTAEKLSTSELPTPLYNAAGVGSATTAVEQRLSRAKILVTRQMAEIELARTKRNSEIVFGGKPKNWSDLQDKMSGRERRKDFENALCASSAFVALCQRKASPDDVPALLREQFRIVTSGVQYFSKRHAEFIARGSRGNVFTVEDLTTSQDMFLREEVSTEESLKVPGIPLRVKKSGEYRTILTKTDIGLYEIGESQKQWAENLGIQLQKLGERSRPIDLRLVRQLYYENREWVNDDRLIIERVTTLSMEQNLAHTETVVVVTTDKKLCDQAAHSANVNVAWMHPLDFYQLCKEKKELDIKSKTIETDVIRHMPRNIATGRLPVAVCIDTGSTGAHLSKTEIVESDKPGKPSSIAKRNLIKVRSTEGKRSEEYSLVLYRRRAAAYSGTFRPSKNRTKRFKTSETSSYRKAHSEDSDVSSLASSNTSGSCMSFEYNMQPW
jgi:hypothetical protein